MKIGKKKINVGVGFVTGRKNFKRVAKTYINNWNESGLLKDRNIALNLFVAYDLKYKKTKVSDYTITDEKIIELVDSALYISTATITNEVAYLMKKKIINLEEAKLIFGNGYAKKRNMVLYFAIKNRMDYLIFLDDDEYPVANIKMDDKILWRGQEVLSSHIKNIKTSDITHGYHCGYISPIPYMEFNEDLSEADFRLYIEAISNDIINWESIKEKMDTGGVTYADMAIINETKSHLVNEENGMKFISGANLGFNLKSTKKIFPFFNPPNARGEDAFLSTSISKCKVKKIPCYTFHDGFSNCESLLLGVLPQNLKKIKKDSGKNTRRFLEASLGWIRYKPLLLYITQKENYRETITTMKKSLEAVLPSICLYFKNNGFMKILDELEYYDQHVEEHFNDFKKTKETWKKIMDFLE